MSGARLGEDLPVSWVYQQKIALEDRERAIPRDLPFTIDLDAQRLSWLDDDRDLLAADPNTRYLVETMAGGIHCPCRARRAWAGGGFFLDDGVGE